MSEANASSSEVGGVSVVVAVYNGELTIGELVHEIDQVASRCSWTHEIILVDDGSTDRSWSVIEDLAARYATVTGVRLRRNVGESSATLCGLAHARHPVIVTLDDDLQQPPSEVPTLLAALGDEVDLVYGVPREMNHGRIRGLVTVLVKRSIARGLGVEHARSLSSFRALRAELCEDLSSMRGGGRSVDVVLAQRTDRIVAVPVRHDARRSGSSNYTLGRLLDHTMALVTGYSVVPLRLASLIGVVLMVGGAAGLVAGSVAAVLGSSFGSIAMISLGGLVLVGLQLVAVGVLGEYVGRLHLQADTTPTYLVRERTTVGDPGRRSLGEQG